MLFIVKLKKTNIKKKPDLAEIALNGSVEEKLEFVKSNLAKEISIKDFFNDEFMKNGIVDIRGVTKGKGFQGPTKRFGLKLKFHKSEKGLRGPGSGGAWHPARVDFTQPMAGQMGYFTRLINSKVIDSGNINDKDINPKNGFKKFGVIKNDYAIIFGSIQGPAKRALLFTMPMRTSKNQIKKNYELLELR